MKIKLKRIIAIVCSIIITLSCSTIATAQSFTLSQEYINELDIDKNYHVTSSDKGTEVSLSHNQNINNSLEIDYIISHSTNIQKSSNSYSGSFKSDKYNAGISGYKYQISFDWVAKISNGNYVFDKITNYTLTTYTNYLLLALAWEAYSYRVIKNTYSFSSDRAYVTCFANYVFDLRDKTLHSDYNIKEENTKIFYLDDLL